MMTTKTMQWTTISQLRRILTSDARLTGIDALFAFLYVLAGFFLPTPDPARDAHVAIMPFLALSAVLVYLGARICGPERGNTTAMFYSNLPRGRAIAYWGHALWLGIFALSMEFLIVISVAIRLGTARPDQALAVSPYMFFLPYVTLAIIMWIIYGPQNKLIRWLFAIPAAAGAIFAVTWLIMLGPILRDSATEHQIMAIGESSWSVWLPLILAALLLLHGSLRWSRTQIGEVS